MPSVLRTTPVTGGRASRGRVPEPLTALFGREQEAALAVSLLRRPDVRLLTLSGPGGVGKTRLAIKIADEVAEEFSDGVRFVALAAVTDDGQVVMTITHALGLVGVGDMPVLDILTDHLRDANLLLIVDNLEHVVKAAPLLTDLLEECPRLKILATSRTLLRLAGEQALPVPPLDLPDPGQGTPYEEITRSAAVALFVNRARAVSPWFDLTADLAPVVAEICRHMDGLPLGIELAAAQIRVLAPVQLLERVRAHLPLPVTGPRDAPVRLRTVRDAVAWSYGLLTADEQSIFRCLGVFMGGFGLDAAEYVMRMSGGERDEAARRQDGETASSSPDAMFDGLVSLVDKSLVHQEPWDAEYSVGEPRFSMLETIRGFALEQLIASGDEDVVRGAHAEWCLSLTQGILKSTFLPGGQQELRRLEVEHPNLRSTLTWLDRRGDRDRLLRLATALGRFWFLHGHFDEGRSWLERALSDSQGVAPLDRARTQFELGQLHYVQGERERGEVLLRESIDVLREHDDVLTLTGALIWTAWMEIFRGDYDHAERVLEEAIARAANIPDPVVAASATSRVLSNLGVVAHERGDLEIARARHEQALDICREIGDVIGVIRSLRDLGDVACDQNDYAGAITAYRECLTLLGNRGYPLVVVNALVRSALAAAVWGQPERAARLLGAAEVARERFRLGVDLPAEQAAHERAATLVRAALGEEGLRAAWAAGRRFSLATAIAEVQDLAPPVAADPGTTDRITSGLSPREEEVLRLLVAGQSDRQIAEALFISVRTAEGHVAHLLAKLGVPTRAAAVKTVAATGLTGPHTVNSALRG